MHETATLHFDLSHLRAGQNFTLNVGSASHALIPHTVTTLAQARQANAALALLPEHSITHYAPAIRLPADALVLLRVTGPRLSPEEPLDRLLLTAIRLPRSVRAAGLARRRAAGGPQPLPAKLAGSGLLPILPPPDDVLIDLHDYTTAYDAAVSLVFHHPELLALQTDAAELVLDRIEQSTSLFFLAHSILAQSKAHDRNPSTPNWVVSQPGSNYLNGQPGNPIYVWSDTTVAYLKAPLGDALRRTKNDPELEVQCWTVQPGVVSVPLETATGKPAGAAAGAPEADYTVKQVTAQSGVTHAFSFDPATSTATVSIKNYYLRWLHAYVEQFDAGGNQVGNRLSLGHISPVDTIMAIPVPPDWSSFRFSFDPTASSARFIMGGLGRRPIQNDYDVVGIALTTVFNFGMPTLFTVLGVFVGSLPGNWPEAMKTAAGQLNSVIEAAAEGPLGWAVNKGFDIKDLVSALGSLASSLLMSAISDKGSAVLKKYIAKAFSEAALEKAEPFVGWVAFAVGAAADLASVLETTVDVVKSPATMVLDIRRTMNLMVTVEPDPRHGQWPATATHYRIAVTYLDGPVYTFTDTLNPVTQTGSIVQTFAGLPAGGTITVTAECYSDTGWLAGLGSLNSVPALPTDGDTLAVTFAIKENLVPLTATTTYNFTAKLGFSGGARVWVPAAETSPPTATVSNLDDSNVGANLGQLGGIGLHEFLSTLAYLWQASGQGIPIAGTGADPYSGQLFSFQALADDNPPERALKFPGVGFIEKPCLAVPPPTLPNPPADALLLEPDLAGSGDMFLRALSLSAQTPFIPAPGLSFGRFKGGQDDLAIHPAGFAVALSRTTCKLQIVRLQAAVADADAPEASILAGIGSRPGLLTLPAAVACSMDSILVLETPPQAPQGAVVVFDFHGNPVSCLAGGQWLAPLRPEPGANVVLVDIGVESKGYIYVLKYLKSDSPTVLARDYRLDIYNPDGSFLTQVEGLAAAALHVDLWRNVYTLNYEILQNSGRTEPSLAEWIPSTP